MTQNTGSSLLFKMLVLWALCLSFQQPAHTRSTTPPSAPASIQVEPLAAMPSWFADGQPTEDAWLALDVLVNAASQGLNPNDYRAQELTLAFEFKHEQQTEPAPEEQARMDATLTAALELYLSDLNNGRLSPSVLKQRFKAPADSRFDARRYLIQARQSGDLAQALKNAQPKVPMYEAVRSAMATYRGLGSQPAWKKPLPSLSTRSLKPDEAWEGLPWLAQRLSVLGDLPPDTPPAERYNEVLVDAVKRFQARHGLDTDGVIGPATLAQLNVSPAQRVEQMALTLERLRWTPLLHGPRMIVVNIPEFVLRAYENKGPQVKLDLEMRVVVGRALDTRTPIFLEEMRFIEFSPYWNIPRSITRNETLPRLRRDPGYFNQQGLEFVSQDGSVHTALTGEALDAAQRGEWRIRQRPGPRNALGDIKFIFPNDQNIYLHHTPAPQLFSRARRDFSHGCIRIEHPVELAQFVLQNQPEWTRERIEQAMSAGKSRTLRLEEPMPVLITYSTVVVKDDGRVLFFSDIYQQDALLKQALGSARAHTR